MSRVDEIQARVDAATAGPWTSIYYTDDRPCGRDNGAVHVNYIDGPGDATTMAYVLYATHVGEDGVVAIMPADLAFIAAAPDDVRWLLARIRELEAGLAEYAKEENWGHDDRSGCYTVWSLGGGYDPRGDNGYDLARAALAGES